MGFSWQVKVWKENNKLWRGMPEDADIQVRLCSLYPIASKEKHLGKSSKH